MAKSGWKSVNYNSKTEVILFDSIEQLKVWSASFPIDILENTLSPVAILGLCLMHIYPFRAISIKFENRFGTDMLFSFQVSRNFPSSVWTAFVYELQHLQGIKKTRTSRNSSITDHLKTLHWLPVKYQINFK